MTIAFGPAELAAIMPETLLVAAGCLLLLLEAFAPALRRFFSALTIVAFSGYIYLLARAVEGMTFSGMLETSPLTRFLGLFLGLAGIVTALVARPYLERAGRLSGEFYALLLWADAGASLMGRGLDLIVIFIGLETLSVSLFVLAAYLKKVPTSTEAGLKFFLTGALASAFILYGIALIFGQTGGTRIAAIAASSNTGTPLFAFGILLLLVGFCFELTLVPFHAWAPDVYQGMPTPAVAYLSVAPKGVTFIVLFRVFSAAFGSTLPDRLRTTLAVIAILSMCLGNLVALAQRDIKRLLAYSGIAHMGYILIALTVFGRDALAAVLIYLFAYVVSNGGAFAAVSVLFRDETRRHRMDLLAGEGRRSGFGPFVLALCMISLAGIPATAGFTGKLFVFKVAIERGFLWLAVVGVANTLVSIGYYLKVVYVLYMRDIVEEEPPPKLEFSSRLALGLCAAGILFFGIFPESIWRFATSALRDFPFLR
jgi:NADH-quinone oxidoreductase subunit N